MCLGGVPQAPDPVATAQAQNNINKDALTTAAQLNQINQTGPYGSVSYSGAVGSPDRTQTTSLSPELQRLLTGQTGVSNSLTDLANTRLAGAPQESFNLPESPVSYLQHDDIPRYNTNVGTNTNFTTNVDGGQINTGFDTAGTAQRGVNTDFGGLTQQAQDAQYSKASRYLDPQFQQGEQDLRSRLSAQGITEGSDAYNREVENFGRSKEQAYGNARNDAILQGDDLQNQLFGQSLGAGQFSNNALAQQFGQNQSAAQFGNTAQQQKFDQGFANAGLNNQAQNDTFNQNLAAQQYSNEAMGQQFQDILAGNNFNQNLYQQGISNDILGRNQNINEAMSYVNGSPVSPSAPQYQPVPTSTAAQGTPDATGLAASNYSTAQNARSQILGSIFGAAGKLGAAGIACWVAREVYGETNPEWLAFREWLFTYAPKWFKRLYIKHGERFALWVQDKPALKGVIRTWMTAQINACP